MLFCFFFLLCVVFFQAEDGIRDLVRSRGLGDVYKRQGKAVTDLTQAQIERQVAVRDARATVLALWQKLESLRGRVKRLEQVCLLYTSDAADERSSVDLGGRRIIQKKTKKKKRKCGPNSD